MSNKKKQTQKNNPAKKADNLKQETAKTTTADNKATVSTDKPVEKNDNKATVKTNDTVKKAVEKTDKAVNKPAEKATEKSTEKTPVKDAEKVTEKKVEQKPQAKETIQEQAKMSKPNKAPRPIRVEQPQKKSGLGTALAILLGIAGTGLGAYSFNELRMLKTNMGGSNDITAQLTGLTDKVSGLEKSANTAELKKQLAELSKQHTAFQEAEERFNERVSKVEQMQTGLSKSVATDIDTALKSRLGAVDTLLAKVKDIELGQQGLSKNLTEVTAAKKAAEAAGMQRQEVAYLLRMANYKLQNEGDVAAATGLLKMAEDKLLAASNGQADKMVDAVREKLIQLSGVKVVDNDALIAELKAVSKAIPQLVVKTDKPAPATDKATTETKDDSVFAQIGSVIASGVKYTPKDPSKIDISSETILIEKRLMQADIKTAELAIRSHNKVLLSQSLQSVKESLGKYFSSDETANTINSKLTALSQSQLETVLPDLSDLVKQFQATQVQ